MSKRLSTREKRRRERWIAHWAPLLLFGKHAATRNTVETHGPWNPKWGAMPKTVPAPVLNPDVVVRQYVLSDGTVCEDYFDRLKRHVSPTIQSLPPGTSIDCLVPRSG